MGLELVIAGRLPLPKKKRAWTFELEHDGDDDLDEGSLDANEVGADDPEFLADVTRVAGFEPKSVVCIRPAGWDMSTIVAEVLAQAVEGLVYFYDYDSPEPHRIFDAAGRAKPAESMKEIEGRIEKASKNPGPFFKRWAREGEKRAPTKPRVPGEPDPTDWSDL